MKKIILAVSLVVITLMASAQKKEYKSLTEAFMSGMSLRGDRGPSGVEWMGDGSSYSFTKKEGRTQQIWTYSIEDEIEELVFSSGDHTFPGSDKAFSYKTSQWAGDELYLLFQTNFERIWRNSGNADYFYYSLEEESMQPIVEDAFTAQVSPDGKMVGYGKDGNLFTFDLASGNHKQLTSDGADKYYNGRFGWANEEEFGLVQAWEWSNDSRFIAFWQSDEREVPIYQLTDFSGQHPEYMEIPYPKVGDSPPVERLGILDVQSGEKKWLDLDPEGGYMPRIYWTARENTLAVVWMNRAQNHLKLYMFDVVTGQKSMVMEEKAETWIDIFDFFAGEMHLLYFPADMESFFWISDRSGYSHIYQYDYEGKLLNQSTEGEYDVVSIKGIDSKKKMLHYLSCEISPMERNIFSGKFNAKSKKRITTAPGNHRVNMSPKGNYFIDSYSDISSPSSIDLRNGKGELITQLAGHDGATALLEAHEYAGKELFTFTTSDGQVIDGYIIKPMHFDPAKSYPLIMDVYGGPGAQGVYNTFETNGWHQWLAQNGYVIANINNRGNGGYGSAFEKCVYMHLGELETRDFAKAALFLSENTWVDRENIAIMGHSYGGFSAGISLLTHGDVFKAGIVASATANHLNYDNIYTERYMGLIDQNAEGYKQSSMITHAGQLEGEMMLVHGLMDDNVHPQNAFQLVKALIDNQKTIDLKIFPPGTHGLAYDMKSRIFLYSQYMDFFEMHLK